jgi:hypothetical protein
MVTFEQLEEASIPLGARLVGELGGFLPFAVVAGPDGALEQVGTDVGAEHAGRGWRPDGGVAGARRQGLVLLPLIQSPGPISWPNLLVDCPGGAAT